MKYLCDTHIFLWWLNNDKRLKKTVRDILESPENIIYASVVSAWEIVIKLKTNPKFKLKTTVAECFQKAGFSVLDIELHHALRLEELKLIHHDPFDRMLIAQAQVEGATIITTDEKIGKYKVDLVKA